MAYKCFSHFMASSLPKESLMKILEITEEDHDAFVLNDYRERTSESWTDS